MVVVVVVMVVVMVVVVMVVVMKVAVVVMFNIPMEGHVGHAMVVDEGCSYH